MAAVSGPTRSRTTRRLIGSSSWIRVGEAAGLPSCAGMSDPAPSVSSGAARTHRARMRRQAASSSSRSSRTCCASAPTAAVRTMQPKGRASDFSSAAARAARRVLSASSAIRLDTEIDASNGVSTTWRPATESSAVRRRPLPFNGSFTTCTGRRWPSRQGAFGASPSLRWAKGRNPGRGRPMSTKAACTLGARRLTVPR